MNWRTVLGTVLIAAAALFGWSAWLHRNRPDTSTGPVHVYDYLMHNFTMVALNQDGSESGTLSAPLMRRRAADQSYAIDKPVFLIPDKNQQHWQVVSDTGWLDAKGNLLKLSGHVVGTSPAQAPPPTRLITDALDVLPHSHQARTALHVTITQPGASTQGTGFQIDTQTHHYVLQSQVQSRYAHKSAR